MLLRGLFATCLTLVLAAPAQAAVFGLKSINGLPDGSGTPTRLFSFEENGSLFSDLGTVNIGGGAIDADALSMSQNHGMMAFQVGVGGSRLVSLGAGSPSATVVGGVLGGRDIRGAVFDLNDKLWVIDSAADELLQIDPLTGGIIGGPVALTIGGGAANLDFNGVDLAVQSDGSMMLVNYRTGYDLDLMTGALTQVFDHPIALYPEIGSAGGPFYVGAAFSASGPLGDLYLYEANGFDDIYRVNGPGFLTRTMMHPNIIPSFNAGRGDLASLMPVNAVPAPGALALLGVGFITLGCVRRRKR